MFLISAHQTYLKNKTLKERLNSSINGDTNSDSLLLAARQQQLQIEEEDLSQDYFNNQLNQKRNLLGGILKFKPANIIINRGHSLAPLIKSTSASCSGNIHLMSTRLNQNHHSESRQMQRTKKYFSSDGHKYLFNNT